MLWLIFCFVFLLFLLQIVNICFSFIYICCVWGLKSHNDFKAFWQKSMIADDIVRLYMSVEVTVKQFKLKQQIKYSKVFVFCSHYQTCNNLHRHTINNLLAFYTFFLAYDFWFTSKVCKRPLNGRWPGLLLQTIRTSALQQAPLCTTLVKYFLQVSCLWRYFPLN